MPWPSSPACASAAAPNSEQLGRPSAARWPVGHDQVEEDEDGIDKEGKGTFPDADFQIEARLQGFWAGTARMLPQHEDGNHHNLPKHGPKLEDDQVTSAPVCQLD